MTAAAGGLTVLAVDDEAPALEDLAFLLRGDPRVGRVLTAGDGGRALEVLRAERVDAAFLDVRMPEPGGLELARRLGDGPAVVFVTAYGEFAVDAFALNVCDYLVKPVRRERLTEAVRRVAAAVRGGVGDEDGGGPFARVPVEFDGVTRFVAREEVAFAAAHGDYVRLHLADGMGTPLVRVPLAALEEEWAAHGFVRVHRRYLVALPRVAELRVDDGRWTVRVAGRVIPVSRRHTRELRDRLVRAALRGGRAG